jgi:hypothetical protein
LQFALVTVRCRSTAGAVPAIPPHRELTAIMLAHNVYFSLIDRSAAARQRLIEACHRFLAPHAGIVFYAAGVLAEELRRDVNVRDFDVGLHIVFVDQSAHDRYQETPAHLQFIAENKANWKGVRVFDSVVEPAPGK